MRKGEVQAYKSPVEFCPPIPPPAWGVNWGGDEGLGVSFAGESGMPFTQLQLSAPQAFTPLPARAEFGDSTRTDDHHAGHREDMALDTGCSTRSSTSLHGPPCPHVSSLLCCGAHAPQCSIQGGHCEGRMPFRWFSQARPLSAWVRAFVRFCCVCLPSSSSGTASRGHCPDLHLQTWWGRIVL